MHWVSVFQKLFSCLFLVATFVPTSATAQTSYSGCSVKENTIYGKFGIRLEPSLLSRVRIRTSPFYRNGSRLSFSFKADQPNGILFYGTVEDDERRLVTLLLIEGRLKFFAKCSSADLDIDLNGPKVDDGKWHSIVFKKDGAYGTVLVDGRRQSRSYQVNCRLDYFEFGGVNSRLYHRIYDGFLKDRGHFDGCIGKVTFTPSIRGFPLYTYTSTCQFM